MSGHRGRRDLEAAGIDVAAQTTCGVHTFGVWDRAWVDARRWRFFGEADTDPGADWSYRTVQQSGTMWDLDFRFDDPPMSVALFERDGLALTGSGSDSVTLTGPDGCERAATLPFEITVADWCLSDEPTSTTTPAPSAPATGAPERGRLPATGTDPGAPTVAAIVTMFVLAVRLRWQRPSVSASRRKGVT